MRASAALAAAGPPREVMVFAGCSIALLFGQGVVFAALGVALHAMARDMGWSAAAAGGGFTAMIVAACLAATLPVWLIARIGGRWTMTGGALVMACGFLVASEASTLPLLTLGTALSGAGFSLLANTPAFAMITGWSGDRAGRWFGLYLMAGAAGTAAGPIAAQSLIAGIGWPGYWRTMALCALLLAGLLAGLLRDPPRPSARGMDGARPLMAPLASFAYAVMAGAMVLTQAAILTVFSAAPAHLGGHGWNGSQVAAALGLQGLVGALGTGLSGFVLRRVPARTMLPAALLAEAAGIAALASGGPLTVNALFVPAFGLGSCLVTLAVTVLLVDHFGQRAGTAGLALIWTLAGAASAGPWLAGLTADAAGSYAPALLGLAALLLPAALGAMLIPAPHPILSGPDA
ncbi:MFS transporter [Novosphingobium sp. KCTC 2891]|uniref:MFS transporter n=1 Tax=Novosphingobium sp. KCTC 2891 TaxID=2989730 RepID=UPI002223515E|nr:MFS transporter [Novosphingobium sp. KCTC 2891]MCW1383745.1 MFS transporter [Novosphingobium sp. KCTC 2891]